MSLKKLLEFSEIIGKLKVTKRSGWVSQVGIDKPESVADHSLRCAILAMCIGDLTKADTEKLVRMLLLHDIQEALTGDYDLKAKNNVGISNVMARERVAVRDILSLLPAELERRYLSIWEEFEDQSTLEAVLARDIDKIEMVMQAVEYEKEGYDPDKLETFWASVQDRIKTSMVRDLFRLLRDRRTVSK